MRVEALKERILENNMVENLLENIGCHSIRLHSSNQYLTCGNPDGDNKQAITVYLNDNLTVVNYTRDILPSGQSRTTDSIDLVSWAKNMNFIQTIRYLCEICNIDYYSAEQEDIPESLRILAMIKEMCTSDGDEFDDNVLQPIDGKILSYYLPCGNAMFEQDNISLETQSLFELGYDPYTNYLTIPIRDELGSLVGVKGRIFKRELSESDTKYVYLEPCAKSKVLYGLYQNLDNIIRQNKVFIVESEKSVMQLYGLGFYGVATGGSKISKHQINLLTRLGVQLVFAYDKDIELADIQKIADKFMEGIPLWALIDDNNILDDKESPSDNPDKWFKLLNNNLVRIR